MKHGCFAMLVLMTIVLTLLGGVAIVATSVNADSQTSPTTSPSSQPIDYEAYDRDQAFKLAQESLGQAGDIRDEVLTFRYPRKDLSITIDGMPAPSAAGFETTFHFYYCPCGKLKVVGQYALAAYEVNDVVDALRKNNQFLVASVAPMLLDEKPRMMLVRFQGEGDGTKLGEALKASFNFIGDARMQKATGM